jgi:mediator of RNA polymerase II transcription subunit 14
MGKSSHSSGEIIRPSKRILYDTREAVVSFLSEDVETCVDEFLTEWARVSKMVVVAREVAKMAEEVEARMKALMAKTALFVSEKEGEAAEEGGQKGIRLLSFDLQTVEFVYAGDYAVSITAKDQFGLDDGAAFELAFSRISKPVNENAMETAADGEPGQSNEEEELINPHEEVEPFLRSFIRPGPSLAPSVRRLIEVLRDTLPIVVELEEIRVASTNTHRQAEQEKEQPGPLAAVTTTTKRARVADTFAKNAGWFRLLYGDLRHALDFRLMSEHRVAVLDGSYSLFSASKSTPAPSSPVKNASLTLLPIPGFKDVLKAAVDELQSGGFKGVMVNVDVGFVCECSDVRSVCKVLHRMVEEALGKAGCFT